MSTESSEIKKSIEESALEAFSLHRLCIKKNYNREHFKALLSQGEDPLVQNAYGWLPIHAIVYYYNLEAFEDLSEHAITTGKDVGFLAETATLRAGILPFVNNDMQNLSPIAMAKTIFHDPIISKIEESVKQWQNTLAVQAANIQQIPLAAEVAPIHPNAQANNSLVVADTGGQVLAPNLITSKKLVDVAALVQPQRSVQENIKSLKENYQFALTDAKDSHDRYLQLIANNAPEAEIEVAKKEVEAAHKIVDELIDELTIMEEIERKAQQKVTQEKKKDADVQNNLAVAQVSALADNAAALLMPQHSTADNVNKPNQNNISNSTLDLEELKKEIKVLEEEYRIATTNFGRAYAAYNRLVRDKASAEEIEAARVAKDAALRAQEKIGAELNLLENKRNKAQREAFEKKNQATAPAKNVVVGQQIKALTVAPKPITPALSNHQQKLNATNNNVNANLNLAEEQNDQEAFNKLLSEVNQAYNALKATKDGQKRVQETKKHAVELNIILQGLSEKQISVNIVEKDSFPTLEITTNNTQLYKMFGEAGFELLGNDGKFMLFPSFKGDKYPGKLENEHPGYSLLMELATLPALNKFINSQSMINYFAIKDNDGRSKFDKFSRYYLGPYIRSCTPKDSCDYELAKKIEHDLVKNYFDLKLKNLDLKGAPRQKNN